MEYFENELEVWEAVSGPSKRSYRRYLSRAFKKYFPEGHETSIRPRVEACTLPAVRKEFKENDFFRSLQKVHHRAFGLIARYGVDYIPRVRRGRPPYGEPRPRACFLNARLLLEMVSREQGRAREGSWKKKIPPMVYVEGITQGPLVWPMLHAWNTFGLDGTIAFDWTFYSGARWTRYIGVPFTKEEYDRACAACGGDLKAVSLFDKRHFLRVEGYLNEVLEKRGYKEEKKE